MLVRSGIASLVRSEKRNVKTKRECKEKGGEGRARQKGGSCPRLMHPWSPKGHETRRRPGSRKRKKKKKKGNGEKREVH